MIEALPQADSLAKLRALVNVVARRRGPVATSALGGRVGLSERHAAYYAHAASVLGLIERDAKGWRATNDGRALAQLAQGSPEEAKFLRTAITRSPTIAAVASDLFAPTTPSLLELTKRIRKHGQGPSTAQRRAETLIRWRKQIETAAVQLQLPAAGAPVNLARARSGKVEPRHNGGRRMLKGHGTHATVSPPARLTGLVLENFKGFARAAIEMGPFTVVVGTNASGKSNLRDALRFLHGIARGYTLPEIIGEKWIEGGFRQWGGMRGGMREVTYAGAESFAIEAKLRVRDGSVERVASYRIKVGIPTEGPPRLLAERLVIDGRGAFVFDSHPAKNALEQDDPKHLHLRLRKARGKGFIGPPVSVIANQPALTQLADHKDVSKEIRDHVESALSALRSMRFLDLRADQMRIASLPGQIVLGDGGENLSSVLQAICDDAMTKKALVKWVRELTPLDVTDFEFVADQTGKILVSLVEHGGRKTSAYSASDGTLRFLAMIAAFLGPDPAHLYFFEELETGLHPSRLHLLLSLIEGQTSRGVTQVIATTHSPQLLLFLGRETIESVTLAYRIHGRPDQRLKRLVDIPDARRVLKKQDIARLHATGWLEDAAELTLDTEDA